MSVKVRMQVLPGPVLPERCKAFLSILLLSWYAGKWREKDYTPFQATQG